MASLLKDLITCSQVLLFTLCLNNQMPNSVSLGITSKISVQPYSTGKFFSHFICIVVMCNKILFPRSCAIFEFDSPNSLSGYHSPSCIFWLKCSSLSCIKLWEKPDLFCSCYIRLWTVAGTLVLNILESGLKNHSCPHYFMSVLSC